MSIREGLEEAKRGTTSEVEGKQQTKRARNWGQIEKVLELCKERLKMAF